MFIAISLIQLDFLRIFDPLLFVGKISFKPTPFCMIQKPPRAPRAKLQWMHDEEVVNH
jgi:hypothetical protein